MDKKIYLDHSATTPLDPAVFQSMKEYFTEDYGNPSSLHYFGLRAREAVEKARESIAGFLNCSPAEIIFTSGGTESDNLALKGAALKNKTKGKHIISSPLEHPAVLNTLKSLEKDGFQITFAEMDEFGTVDIDSIKNSIKDDTILISVMHASNEIGTIQPVKQIGQIAKDHEILFHTDAVQSFGKINVDVQELNVDMASISSHKIYGPKGVGALYIRRGVKLSPLLHGGGHERNIRSGTENVPGIAGFGKAVEICKERLEDDSMHLTFLRDRLIKGLLEIPDSYLTGHPSCRLPNHASFIFKYIEGESMLLLLDQKGIAGSTGSACSSKELKASHTLLSLGIPHEEVHGSLRLSLGRKNNIEEIDYTIKVLPEIVEKLRKMSPLSKR